MKSTEHFKILYDKIKGNKIQYGLNREAAKRPVLPLKISISMSI